MEKRLNSVLRQRHAGQKGFTLIELLVVIAVLAILAAIVLFNVTGVANRGTASACATDVKSVQVAVDSYMNDHPTTADPFAADVTASTLPAAAAGTNIWTLVVPTYLHVVPNVAECKTAMKIAYSVGASAANGYTISGS
jgi:prepilin-type N-terminal cleavage/methylation domain-containing protein